MRAKLPSAGHILQIILALAVALVAAIPYYRGAAGNLATIWFFLAIVVGALIGHPGAFLLAPVPFLLGANLGRRAQGPMPSGSGIYPGYEYDLGVFVMALIGAIGILIGILLRRWVGARDWRRAGSVTAVLMILVVAWGNGLYREVYPPTVGFEHTGAPGGGFMMELRAIGDQGATAHTQSAPHAGQGAGQVCVPGPASDTPPRFTISGQRFKPGEAVRIEGQYIAADCIVMVLAGQARADATGAFTVDIEAEPDRGPPPE